MSFRTKIYCIIVFCLGVVQACKKEQEPPQPEPVPPKINAMFAIERMCSVTELTIDSLNYIDSIFRFKNLSDTGQYVTYKWFFGDGMTSTEKNPSYSYQKSGVYGVTLLTYYKGNPSDTFARGVHIIIGQKKYSTNFLYTRAVDIANADANSVIGVVTRYNDFMNPSGYSLFKVDSLLNHVWTKPITGVLNSLQRLNDGNYISSGNYSSGATTGFAISKINNQGDLIWTKLISNLTGTNVYTSETSDGGILTIGNGIYQSPNGNIWSYAAVIKCDGNGNEIWRKTFDSGPEYSFIKNPLNFIEINGEYFFASNIRTGTPDSLVIVRLGANGNLLQQNKVFINTNSTIFGLGIAKAGNTFLVYLNNTRTAAFFRNDLSFIKYMDVSQTGINHVIGKDDKFYLCEGNFQNAFAWKLNEDGSENWAMHLGGWIRIGCSGLLSGANRYGKRILLTPYGDIVAISDGEDNYSTSGSSSAFLYRLTYEGSLR